MADARHDDFARINVEWGCHLQLAHQRSARLGADVQAVSAACRPSGLQQLPDRGGRTYMMPGRIIPEMAASPSTSWRQICQRRRRSASCRWVETAPPSSRGRHHAIPTPQHRETERMECGPEARSTREHEGLLGSIWSPQLGLTSTLARPCARAWRAGCRETCTSGSVRGMKRLVTAK